MDPNEGRYILLPREGVRASTGPAYDVLVNMPIVRSTGRPQSVALDAAAGRRVRVVDTTAENGPKLVELDDAAADALNRSDSPVRAVPVVVYRRPDAGLSELATADADSPGKAKPIVVKCTDGTTGVGVADVKMTVFTDFAQRIGVAGMTDATGTVKLLPPGPTIDRIFAEPPGGYWGGYRYAPAASPTYVIPLTPIDLTLVDAVRHFYGNSQYDAATGVKVAVVDTGVGPHGLLNVVSGRNTVTGEPAGNAQDGSHHGTHVAGLIGANGSPPTGLRGVAPGVSIASYRVFPPKGGATNYAILKALIFAANDGCDIVNLSLGGGPFDPIVSEAILDARTQGMLVVIAAGNDGRSRVNFPAAYTGATAVSAMGRQGTFPVGSIHEAEVLRPPTGTVDPAEFIAAFSNIGPEVAVTGPGVGVLSTLPGNAFGPLSGTSMAAPVVAGAAACLLSRDAVIYSMARTVARADAIQQLLQKNCVKRGFGAMYEGYGLPDPGVV